MAANTTSNPHGAEITVYWLNKSRAHRIIWLLEELQLTYTIKVFFRQDDQRAPPELKKIHPLGRAPIVGIKVPGKEKEIVIAESATVLDYLCKHFGREMVPRRYTEGMEGVLGEETDGWMRYRFLMDYAEGSAFNGILAALLTAGIRKAPIPFFIKPISNMVAGKLDEAFVDPELKVHFDFLEKYLEDSPSNGEFFCGDTLTAADIMIHFVVEAGVQRVPLTDTHCPKLYRYVRRLQQRDAYKRAGERVSKLSGEQFVPFSDLDLY